VGCWACWAIGGATCWDAGSISCGASWTGSLWMPSACSKWTSRSGSLCPSCSGDGSSGSTCSGEGLSVLGVSLWVHSLVNWGECMTCAVINGEIVRSIDSVDAPVVLTTSTGVLAVGLGIHLYHSSASSLASSN
jgi:hypothetical protein